MKIQKYISTGMLLLLLASCGPAKIVPVFTPTLQPSLSSTSTPVMILPTQTQTPSAITALRWDIKMQFCRTYPINCIRDITMDSDGNLWVASEFGVVYWDLSNGKFIYAELIEQTDEPNRDWMNSIAIAGDNTIIAASSHGRIFAFQNGKWIEEVKPDRTSAYWMSLFVQPDGSVWASAFLGDFYRYSDGNWTYEDLHLRFECWATHITSDLNGIVWAVDDGCPKGRSYLRKFENGEWVQVGDYFPSQLVFNGETIWFDDYYNNEEQVCQIVTDTNIECFIFPEKNMWSMSVLFGKKDETWIQSFRDDSIWYLNHGKWEKIDYPMTTHYVSTIYVTAEGVVFMGTYGLGIIEYDSKSKKRYIVNYAWMKQ